MEEKRNLYIFITKRLGLFCFSWSIFKDRKLVLLPNLKRLINSSEDEQII